MRRVATTPKKVTGFSAAPGRPRTNLGQYMLRPTTEVASGYEMLNDEPDPEKRAKEYMKRYELPPALQPQYLRRPAVLQKQDSAKISKGFVKPKSHQG